MQRPVGEEALAAGDHGVAVDHALHAEALGVGERLDRASSTPALAGAGGDGPGDRVLAGVLERAGQAQHLVHGRCPSAATTSTRAIWPVVTVPVLSRTIGVDPAGGLEHLRALDEDAELGAPAGADHAGRWAWPGRGRTGRR